MASNDNVLIRVLLDPRGETNAAGECGVKVAIANIFRAKFPNDVVMEQEREGLFVLRCGDYIWDWGLYEWSPRWVYDTDNSDIDTSWFVGRYLVPASKIATDFDTKDADYPGGPVAMAHGGLPPTERPVWFKQRK
jgi:hypothetical protein